MGKEYDTEDSQAITINDTVDVTLSVLHIRLVLNEFRFQLSDFDLYQFISLRRGSWTHS